MYNISDKVMIWNEIYLWIKLKNESVTRPKSPFSWRLTLRFASSDAANKALLRLEEAGLIRRILFGVYDTPIIMNFWMSTLSLRPTKWRTLWQGSSAGPSYPAAIRTQYARTVHAGSFDLALRQRRNVQGIRLWKHGYQIPAHDE